MSLNKTKSQCQIVHTTVQLATNAPYRAVTKECQYYTLYTCDVYLNPQTCRSYCHIIPLLKDEASPRTYSTVELAPSMASHGAESRHF